MIFINVDFFSDSRTFVWPGPRASLQNMEAEVLAWAWANTKEDREMALDILAFGHLGIWALGIWVGGIEGHLCQICPSK